MSYLERVMSGAQDSQKQTLAATPTGGEWTNSIEYVPSTKEAIVTFNNGFQAAYPADYDTFVRLKNGTTSKTGSPNSVGAALHKMGLVHNYRRV